MDITQGKAQSGVITKTGDSEYYVHEPKKWFLLKTHMQRE